MSTRLPDLLRRTGWSSWAKSVTSVVAAVATVATLSGCGGSSTSNGAQGSASSSGACGNGPLAVGTSADFPPMEFRDPQNPSKFTGFEIDMVTSLMRHVGCQFAFKDASFAGLIPAVQAGHVSLVASDVYHTAERAKVVDFVDYMRSGLALMVPTKNAGSFTKNYLSFCGKNVGLLTGSPSETAAIASGSTKCQAAHKSAIKTQTYQSVADELQQMKTGRLDGILEDLITEGYVQSKSPGAWTVVFVDPSTVIKVGIVFKQGSPLETKMKDALQWFMTSGGYKQIADKYKMPKSSLLTSSN